MLSICIVSYNVKRLLRQCIRSIYAQASQLSLEIIVVDNCSSDGTADMVRREFPNVMLVENSVNEGFAKASNQAMEFSEGEFILLLNPDTIVLPGTLSATLEFMRQTQEAGIVGCRLVRRDGNVEPSCKSLPSLWVLWLEMSFLYKVFPKSRFFGTPYMTYFGYDEIKEVDAVKGAFLMVRRSTIEEIGLLDEGYFIYSEEVDLCYRAKRRGWKVYFYPDAQVIHYGGASSKLNRVGMFIELQKSRYRFFRKHRSRVVAWVALTILFGGVLARSLIWSVVSAVKNGDYAVKRKVYVNTLKWYVTEQKQ